jgi:hypothetical protein
MLCSCGLHDVNCDASVTEEAMGHCHGNPLWAVGAEADTIGDMKPAPDPQYRHRIPAEIIRQAVWLYNVFSLGLRDRF